MSNIYITAKCSDLFGLEFEYVLYTGYVPRGIGIGGGDFIKLEIDNETGKIIGWKPLTIESLKNFRIIKE